MSSFMDLCADLDELDEMHAYKDRMDKALEMADRDRLELARMRSDSRHRTDNQRRQSVAEGADLLKSMRTDLAAERAAAARNAPSTVRDAHARLSAFARSGSATIEDVSQTEAQLLRMHPDDLIAKAMPAPQQPMSQIAWANAKLNKGLAEGRIPLDRVPWMQAIIHHAEIAEAGNLAKATRRFDDDDETNEHSNRAKPHRTQTDHAGVCQLARHMLKDQIVAGKYPGVTGIKREQQINQLTARSGPAATNDAVDLMADMARECGLKPDEVATYEAPLHGLGYTLGIGSASDMPDPMAAA
ncbi:MAG: hypothetical protein M3Y41_22330 [Pseudomonadota bacterium]|nr:hypothetical protein [Pseudomonadota bacterium]